MYIYHLIQKERCFIMAWVVFWVCLVIVCCCLSGWFIWNTCRLTYDITDQEHPSSHEITDGKHPPPYDITDRELLL